MTGAAALIPRSTRAADNEFEPRDGFEPFDPADAEQSIPQRFQQVALRHPRAMALVDGDRRVPYVELQARAFRIAAALREHLGDRPGPVALRIPAGAAALETLLGVLFAGRAYLFLDPSAPDEEISRLLLAAAPAAIVFAGADAARTRACGEPLAIPLEALTRERPIAAARTSDRPDAIDPRALAVIFATSGSTGSAKLVGLSHRAVVFDIGRQINDLCLGPDDRFDLLFAPSFSASLSPIFSAWLTGGELHVLDPGDRLTTLADWMARSRITVSTMSTTTLRALCSKVVSGGARPRPRLISVGGETLLSKDVAAFEAAFPPPCVLQNAMASTEARTYAQYFVPRGAVLADPLPIGWPVHGKDVTVIDEDGRPAAPGQAGEITIRSRFLADGYVNDPALTASRFLAQADGTVLFRTGDRARRREDGALVFIGRADALAKIRGYRVEPGAVETALVAHPGVGQAAVVVRPIAGDAALAAYVVPAAGATIASDDLRSHLARHLPAHAVPSAINLVPSLPLNRNGKVDRQALAEVDPGPEERSATRDEIAAALLDIWRGILDRGPIAPSDNFFERGGDSLSALRVQTALHDTFGVDAAFDVLVQHPTVESLATWVEATGTRTRPTGSMMVLQDQGTADPLFCVPGIGGEPLTFQPLVSELGADRPVYGFRFGVDLTSAGRPIEAVAAELAGEVTRVLRPDAPVLLCGHSFGALVALEMARALQAAGRSVRLFVIDTPWRDNDTRPFARRVWDALANLPGWLRYDAFERGWRSVFVRAIGTLHSRWRRVRRAAASAAEPELNVQAYFGIRKVAAPFYEILNARYRAAVRYMPAAYPGAVTLFRALGQPPLAPRDRRQGWQTIAAGRVEVFDVPGNHDSCLDEPHVRVLAERLTLSLRTARPTEPARAARESA